MERSTRQARLDRRRGETRRDQMKWIVYIVLIAVVIAGLMILINRVHPAGDRVYTQTHGLTIGDPSAPVKVTEYADFQCIHCFNEHSQVEYQLIQEYVDTGKVLFTYVPVGFLGQESVVSAQAAYCAAAQELFWPYHDAIFANYSSGDRGGYSVDRLVSMSESIGADGNALRSCIENGDGVADYQAGMAEASALGVNSTPTFFVNGTMFKGEQPFDQLRQAIEAALAAADAQ